MRKPKDCHKWQLPQIQMGGTRSCASEQTGGTRSCASKQTGGTRSCASLPVAEDCDPPKSELVAADCDPPKSEPVAAVAEDCDPPKQTSPQNCAQECAQVMHKERGKEKCVNKKILRDKTEDIGSNLTNILLRHYFLGESAAKSSSTALQLNTFSRTSCGT